MVEFALNVLKVPSGALLPTNASMFVGKTQLTLLLLRPVSVILALDCTVDHAKVVPLTSLLAMDTV